MRLQGKKAVVTGGGTGIGRAVALALAAEGCHVAIGGRREEPLKETSGLYFGKPAIAWKSCDVTSEASVNEFFAWASSNVGPPEIVVLSAGVNVAKRRMAELSVADWDKMMQANVTGAFYCYRAILPGMRERRDGLIVNINSISGKRANPLGGVGYCASKFAFTALGMAAALEEAEYGIRVSNVYPGEVDTPILEHRPTPVTAEHRARILKPEDIAAAVMMIACLPPRAHVPELIVKPSWQAYM